MFGLQLHEGVPASMEHCFVNGGRRQQGGLLCACAMYLSRGPLGLIHVLLPACELLERLELFADAWTAAMVARDVSGAAAVFRQWRAEPIGRGLNGEEAMLSGCDLAIRPDLYRDLYRQAAGWVSGITIVRSSDPGDIKDLEGGEGPGLSTTAEA